MGRRRSYTPTDRARRKCLRCLEWFMSDHKGNRRCRKCQALLEANDDFAESDWDGGHKVSSHLHLEDEEVGVTRPFER